MGIIDEYNQNAAEEGQQTADPADTRRKRAEIERQIVISESDFKRIVREMEELEGQRRRLKKDEERIRIERDDLDIRLKKMETDKSFLEEEIKRLKKSLKTLKVGG